MKHLIRKEENFLQYISERYSLRGDLIAHEDLRNYTLVIRDGEALRYMNEQDDITKIDAYFVNHIFPLDCDDVIITKGNHVRVAKVSLLFGLIG